MDTKTALGAAGGITLTVVGAVSALALTFGGGTAVLGSDDAPPAAPVVEVVDQYGNPIDLQQPASTPEIVVTQGAASESGAVSASQESTSTEPYAGIDEHEEHEEHEDEEHGTEYEEEDDD